MARVAVLDDSKFMRNVLQSFLTAGGHEVELWEPMSAAEVLERVTASKPDLLITDFQMPGANGATVTKMAKKARPEMPVLVLTSLRDTETLDLLARLQANGVVHKPISGEALLEAVEKALAK